MTLHGSRLAPQAPVGERDSDGRELGEGWSRIEGAALLGLPLTLGLFFFLNDRVALLAGLAAAGLASMAPRIGLLAALATLPLIALTRPIGSFAFASSELLVLASAVGSAARSLAPRSSPVSRPRFTATPLDRPTAWLLVSALLSLLVSEYLRLSLRELRTLVLEPILAYYLLVAWFPGRLASWPVGAFLAGAVAIAGAGLAGALVGWGLSEAEGVRRVQALYSSPNHFGLLLGRALPWLLALGWLLPAWRPPAMLGAGVVGAALVGTFSIGAWIGSGAAILVLAWMLGGRRLLVVTAGLLIGTGGVALALLRVDRVWSHLDPEQGTTFFRLRLWESALAMVRDHPLFGIGLDNFLYLYQQRYIDPSALAEANLSHPHNLILHFWLQLGLLGLLAALWLLARMFSLGLSRLRTSADRIGRALAAGAVASLVDFVVHGLVDNSYFLPDLALIFWLTAAVLATNQERVT
jgi:putative inorganic carbon (HCO3(-)) transporter